MGYLRFFMFATWLACSGCAAAVIMPATLPVHEMRALTADEKKFLATHLSASLKDPDSAQFRWAPIQKDIPPDGVVDYCAQVNAKNSYGGYVGFQPFDAVVAFVNGKIAVGSIGALAAPGEENFVAKICRDKGLDPYAVPTG